MTVMDLDPTDTIVIRVDERTFGETAGEVDQLLIRSFAEPVELADPDPERTILRTREVSRTLIPETTVPDVIQIETAGLPGNPGTPGGPGPTGPAGPIGNLEDLPDLTTLFENGLMG